MTQPNQFRYTLAVRGLFNYVIPEAPKGWEGSLITFDRSESYYGMIRTFTIPMDFVLDGAKILRTEFYQYGLAGRVEFIIEELNNSDWTYSEIYRGDIDFSTVVDASSLEGYTFTVNVMEGGISAAIKAYENQVYEIPVNVPEAIDIQLTPISLTETADLIFLLNIDHRSDAFFALQVVNNQQNSVTPSVQDSGFVADSAASFDNLNDNFFYKATVDTDIRLQGNLKGNVSTLPGGAKHFQVNVYKSDNILVATLYDVTTNFGIFDFSWDFTTSILKDERLFFYFKNVTDNNTNVGFQVTDGTLSLAYQTITPASMCKGLRPKYVFDKLIELMNDAVYPTLSYHLDTTWPQLTITCGDAIRQITDAKIKISFKDFFQSINSVTNAGFGIQNDTAVLEAKGYWQCTGC